MVKERKRYIFSNYFRNIKNGLRTKQVEVYAETILEAKEKVKEMGCKDFYFERIVIDYVKV